MKTVSIDELKKNLASLVAAAAGGERILITRHRRRDLTLDLCRSRIMSIVSTPRSLALARLRTALWFHERDVLTRFVSRDAGRVQGARELGRPVWARRE